MDACAFMRSARWRKGTGLIFPDLAREVVSPRGLLARQRKVAWLRLSVPRVEFSFLLEDRTPWNWFSRR
jgi:hypothetical protein